MFEKLRQYHEMGKKIEKFLRPSTYPLAIKLIKEESEIPHKCKRPTIDLDVQNFICQNFKMSRSYGWTIAVLKDDIICSAARMVYGWDPFSLYATDNGHNFELGLYAKDIQTARKIENHFYKLNGDFIGLIISPLSKTKIIPDIVQIYGFPAQIMRLTQSYLYMEGGVLSFEDLGRIGSCHIGVVKAFQTNKPQLVLLGNGDRVWGGAQDTEVMFAIPEEKLGVILEGLEATHKGGLRYPIPTYMNYEPGFQKNFEKSAIQRAGGTLIRKTK